MNTMRLVTYVFTAISVLMGVDMLMRGGGSASVDPIAPVATVQDVNRATVVSSDPLPSNGAPINSVSLQGWDIIGIRPGMTPDQVRAALSAYRPKGRYWPALERWADGKDFTRTLSWDASTFDQANPKRRLSSETVAVMFSGPSSGNKAMAVKRSISYDEGEGLVADRLRDSLHQKYGTSPESTRFGGEYVGVREKVILGVDGQPLMVQKAYGTPACSITIGRETIDGIGSFDGACGNMTMSWLIRGQRIQATLVDSFNIEIKDIGFAISASAFDQIAFDKLKEEVLSRKANGNEPRL